MAVQNFRGKKGEQHAEDYLLKQGFTVLERNYRHKRAEIDLIVRKEQLLVFVEVKYRTSVSFGFPEEFVSEAQAGRIKEAAENYLELVRWNGAIRFDIIAISGDRLEIEYFQDAF